MKRSEMVAKIYNALYGASMREDFANQILEVVEACGMAPPAYTRSPDQYNRADGTYGFEVHEWEDEHE